MSSLPRQELHASLQMLADKDEYKNLVRFIREERDRFFSDLRPAADANEVMKIAGSVAALDELLAILDIDAGAQ